MSFWIKKIGGSFRNFILLTASRKISPFSLQKRLNQKLVASFAVKKLPNWQQVKHLPLFLSPLEKKIIKLAGLVLAASLLTWGFGYYQTHKLLVPTVGGEYIEGVVGYPSNINPLFAMLNAVDADLTRLVYAGLFKYDAKLNLVPDLAEKYTVDANRKLYTFTLKPNLRWHDGEPVTSNDVLFTLERLRNTDTKSPLLYGFQNIVFTKIDDLSFTLELPEPYAPFLHLLTTGLLPEHLWAEIDPTNMKLSALNLKPVGAGPFLVSDLTKDTRGVLKTYTVKPNHYYHGAAPFLASITFKFFSDRGSALEALKNKQVQGLSYLLKEEKAELTKKSLVIKSLRLPQYTAVFFNDSANPLLKELALKKALNVSVDREILINQALLGEGAAVWGPILPGQIGYSNKLKAVFDLEEANKILDAAKWEPVPVAKFLQTRKNELITAWLNKRTAEEKKDEAASGRRPVKKTPEELAALQKEKEAYAAEVANLLNSQLDVTQKFFRQKNGQTLALKLTVANQNELIQTANLLKSFWQASGAQINLEIIEANRIKNETIKNRDYAALLYGVVAAADPDPFPFWHSSQTKHPGLNLALFSNRSADTLLEKARGASSPEERINYYLDFQKILAENLPAIFLYNPNYLYAQDSSLQGFEGGRLFTPADRFNGVTSWYKKTKISFK